MNKSIFICVFLLGNQLLSQVSSSHSNDMSKEHYEFLERVDKLFLSNAMDSIDALLTQAESHLSSQAMSNIVYQAHIASKRGHYNFRKGAYEDAAKSFTKTLSFLNPIH